MKVHVLKYKVTTVLHTPKIFITVLHYFVASRSRLGTLIAKSIIFGETYQNVSQHKISVAAGTR